MKMMLLPPLWNMEVGEDILVTYGLQSQELLGGILLYLKWLTENFAGMQEYINTELKFWEDALVVCDADIGLWYKTEAVHPIVEGDEVSIMRGAGMAMPTFPSVNLGQDEVRWWGPQEARRRSERWFEPGLGVHSRDDPSTEQAQHAGDVEGQGGTNT